MSTKKGGWVTKVSYPVLNHLNICLRSIFKLPTAKHHKKVALNIIMYHSKLRGKFLLFALFWEWTSLLSGKWHGSKRFPSPCKKLIKQYIMISLKWIGTCQLMIKRQKQHAPNVLKNGRTKAQKSMNLQTPITLKSWDLTLLLLWSSQTLLVLMKILPFLHISIHMLRFCHKSCDQFVGRLDVCSLWWCSSLNFGWSCECGCIYLCWKKYHLSLENFLP